MTTDAVTGRVVHARVVDEPLDVAEHLAAVTGPATGATDVFVGTIRDHDPDVAGAVARLEYEAHPDAEGMLAALAGKVALNTGATVAVSHRHGSLGVGDVAVVIASAAPHRREALESTRALIELIKTEVPIWKRQTDTEGRSDWVGL
ncbi:molybdenum cofactor biosynthesis protein MoaE [Aeromicrobium choanae]|uniref:Molybdopterin synthase subunit MoaE n=1 Tax=Aeromicrobium choanae TaxID=1736691 RepID=A0A1T4YSY4_9ACTN|nr:molybdenum cofactor biosynthesis protein MoaE [Aeromicrobium choanae]SKB04840.1 molybdopterin synthase subunit MoaE [Aeromicrobium choanae]